jgi:outer membrane protein assembly factor BamB
MNTTGIHRACALALALFALAAAGCGDSTVGGAAQSFSYDVPLDARSPWPKFRRNSAQDGRSPIRPEAGGGRLWTFATGKGIFSSPVIDAAGDVLIGSADRTFYSIAPDGTARWTLLTGEIIDSSALLDDRGRVYFGSGDGNLYALDAATGAPLWTFTADDPSVNGAFIRWFEGNVAIGTDGSLFAPNDNFFTYALDRDTAAVRWRFKTADQTWSLPALDAPTGQLFIGNNNLLKILGSNTFSLDAASGAVRWSAAVDGTIAASPMLTGDGKMVVGGFDGFVRCYDQTSGALLWSFGARDHIYASPGALPDGTIVQPSADGTAYALDPNDGHLVWQFDTRDALRSSPAIDGDGNVYFGSGEGRLFVLNPDGTLRWSLQLIDAARDDLNASPALGRDAIVIAGESGEVFSVPYDYCLRAEAAADSRCRLGPGEDLPDEGAHLFYTTQFGRQLSPPPAQIEANQPLTFSLFVRQHGDTVLAHIDSSSVEVGLDPPTPVRSEVSGDRKFLTIVPTAALAPPAGAPLHLTIRGNYLVHPDRDGLRFSGGEVGGSFAESFDFAVASRDTATSFPLPIPAQPGDPAGVFELSRIAAPLPTILPSYNQIGFDSIHYLITLVESSAPGKAIAWVAGAKLAEGENRTVIDPASHVLFAVEASFDGGLLTLENEAGFTIEFNGIRLPFDFFRVATRLDASGDAIASPALNVLAPCAGISFYGPFLRELGFCNPQTDILDVFGGAELHRFGDGTATPPTGVGGVSFSASHDAVRATLDGSSLALSDHLVSILLVDAGSGLPVSLDYGFVTQRSADASGALQSIEVPFGEHPVPASVRAWLMVDDAPAAVATVQIP